MGFTSNFNYCMDNARYSSYRFAKILGVNLQSVSNWKNGTVVPHPKTRQKIADHFGITLADLDGDELPVLPEQGIKKAHDPKTVGEDSKVSKAINFVRCASPDEINEIENFFAYLESKRKNNETKS